MANTRNSVSTFSKEKFQQCGISLTSLLNSEKNNFNGYNLFFRGLPHSFEEIATRTEGTF